jgi:hypothetical protein
MSRDRSPVVSLGIFSEASDKSMCPGVDSDSKNEYQDIPGGKGGRCVGLTTLPPSCAECLEIWKPQGLSRLVMGIPFPLPFQKSVCSNLLVLLLIFRIVRKIAKKRLLPSSYPSVITFVLAVQLCFHWRDFHENRY